MRTLLVATRELEHLALHRADVVELAEHLVGVFVAELLVLGGLHQLDVAADDGERRLQVVDDAGQEAADRA